MKKSSPTLNLVRFLQSQHRKEGGRHFNLAIFYSSTSTWSPNLTSRRTPCDRHRLAIERPSSPDQPWFLRVHCTKCGWEHQDNRLPQQVIQE